MRRNVEIGQACRTVFLPTVAALNEWWVLMREQYPVMAYYRPGLAMLPSCRDDNEECEWIAGPTVEAVIGQMLLHLGLSVQAVWTAGHWDGAEWLDGWWSIPELNDCPLTGAARLFVSDRAMDAVAASNLMLRQLALRDQDVFSVYVGSQMDDFIADEVAARHDQLQDGGTDFYGHRNEGREPQQRRVRNSAQREIKERTNIIRESMLALKKLKHSDSNYVTTEEVISELERLLDKARARMLEPRLPEDVMASAVAAFGSDSEARRWFMQPATGLSGTRPLELVDSQHGLLTLRAFLARRNGGSVHG